MAGTSEAAPVAGALERRWALVVGAGLAALAFLAALTEMRDADAFHHLAMGRDLFRRGGFSVEDPFLYPLAGQPSAAPPSWLGSLFVFLSQHALGDAGPVVLAGLLTAALFAVMYADVRGEARRWPELAVAVFALLLALPVVRARAVPRPEIFATVLLATTALALRRFADGRRALLYAFPALAVLWANLHASLLLGVGLVAAFAGVEGALELLRRWRRPAAPPRLPLRDALVAAGLGAAGLVAGGLSSPAGFGPLGVSLRFVASSTGAAGVAGGDESLLFLKHLVAELRPMSPAEWSTEFGVLVGLGVVGAVAAGRRARAWELLAAAAVVLLASRSVRYAVMAAVVAAPVVGRNLAVAVARLRERAGPRWAVAAVVGLALAGAGVVGWRLGANPELRFGVGLRAEAFPVAAAQYLARAGRPARLFNTFHYGGYLEWVLDQPVFQDGRGGLKREDADAAFTGPLDRARFKALDDRYRFDALVVGLPSGIDAATAAVLDASQAGADWVAERQTWALVAFDDGGLLYLRRDGPFAALAARDEYRVARPGNPYNDRWLAAPGARAAWVADYRRALEAAPSCRRCRVQLGLALLYGGAAAEAEPVLAAALPGAIPEVAAELWHALAIAAEVQGQSERARDGYRESLRLRPRNPPARRALAASELARGDAAAAWRLLGPNLEGQAAREDLLLGEAVQRRLGNEAEARRLAARAQDEVTRQRAEALYLEGVGHLQAQRAEQAAGALRASLDLVEASGAAHANLGWAYYELGAKDAAAAEFRRAVQLDPSIAVAYFGLGLVARERGDRPAAAEAFRRYLEREPRGYWAQKAAEHLRALEP